MDLEDVRTDKTRIAELQRAGRWKDAFAACERVLKSTPEDVDMCHRAATILLRLGRQSHALEMYRREAALLRQQNQFAKVQAVSKLILQIDPADVEALADLRPASRRPLFVPPSEPARAAPSRVTAAMLNQLPVLEGVDAAELETLAPVLVIRRLRKEEVIWETGGSLEGIALLTAGVVRAEYAATETGDDLELIGAKAIHRVAMLRNGALLGAVALFTDTPAHETLVAETEATLLVLPRPACADIMCSCPDLGARLVSAARNALLNEAIERSEILAPLATVNRDLLVAQAQVRVIPAGISLIRQDVVAGGLYALLDGKCRVRHRADDCVEEYPDMNAGDAFGELSLLSGMPAGATIETTTSCVVLGLSRTSVLAAVEAYPNVAGELLSKGAEREARAVAGAQEARGIEVSWRHDARQYRHGPHAGE